LKPHVITKLASQIDLAPTLLGILNISYDTKFYGVNLLQSDPKRAFISNYQKVGYLSDEVLVVLGPMNSINCYTVDGEISISCNAHISKTAIGYFQTASNWRKYNAIAQVK
jgi:hypothetical protein